MGQANTAYSYGEAVFGVNAETYLPNSVNGFDPLDRLFVVGNGTDPVSNRSNAITILKNGNIGIGTITPAALLHLEGGDLQLGISQPVNDIVNSTRYNILGGVYFEDMLFTAPAISEMISDSLATVGGLTHFTETLNTTDSASVWEPSIGTDVGIVLQTRGTGYIAADAPDGTATGGNARGDNAVDLQVSRLDATYVASGNFAAISGGASNTASSEGATVGGGIFNNASGQRSTIGGGDSNEATAERATVGGGRGNNADGQYATIPGGRSLHAPLLWRSGAGVL